VAHAVEAGRIEEARRSRDGEGMAGSSSGEVELADTGAKNLIHRERRGRDGPAGGDRDLL